MNSRFLKSQYAGFRLDDTLATRLKWNGVARVEDVSKITKNPDEPNEFSYYSIRDDNGARLTCFNALLGESLVVGEFYEFSGEIKIGKGGTFLNVKSATPFLGNSYVDKNGEENE